MDLSPKSVRCIELLVVSIFPKTNEMSSSPNLIPVAKITSRKML